jgi:hypothetical protein
MMAKSERTSVPKKQPSAEPSMPGMTFQVSIADIKVPPRRLRRLQPDAVAGLTESMRRGLLQAILIYPQGPDYILAAGRRRLEGAKALGWKTIKAEVIPPEDAELAEIDENLFHAELSPAERAIHVTRRKEIYEEQHPGAPKHGGDRRSEKSKSQNENLKCFIDDTSPKTGKGRSTIARDVTRGNEVVVLPDIVGTSLDQGDEIDALAKLPEDEQRNLPTAPKLARRSAPRCASSRSRASSASASLA